MGKRSNFKRRRQDAYDTPAGAVVPLMQHLPARFSYAEPCAGNLSLVKAIDDLTLSGASATLLSDVEPRDDGVERVDALEADIPANTDYIITNPPWTRSILHPMIERFSGIRPTWLLFDADWMHTKQAVPYLSRCRKIVSVGRVSWMQNGTSGLDNCAWYLFDNLGGGLPEFVGRDA